MLAAHGAKLRAADAADASAPPERRLEKLGLKLPPAATAVANYVPAVRTGNLVFLAGHLPRTAGGELITGTVRAGNAADEARAAAAAREATLAMLGTLKAEIGDLAKVRRVVRVGVFVNSAGDFTRQPQVANGCSDLLVAIFGDKGRHARAAIGVNTLPLGVMVETEMVVEVE
ncbi:MAG: RidA family protein [Opitutaceae bacterium]|nr:RidA family protein [Opitutaceae bacterium]